MEMEELQGYTGWARLSERLSNNHPFFENLFLWDGFDISCNIYLLTTREGALIIDPGNDYTAYYELFRQSSIIRLWDIKKILLTHGHSEHSLGLFELLRSYPSIRTGEKSVEVYLHESAPETLKNLASQLGCQLNFVQNDDVITLGEFSLMVLHTPGHTMDSLCFWHEGTKSLFSGDTVIPFAVASPDPVAGGRIDFHLFSMRNLRKRDIRHLLPGHGDVISEGVNLVLEGNYAGLIKKVVGLQCPWMEASQFLLQKGYLEEALFCCEKVLQEDSKNPTALYFKACCLNDMGLFKEALDTLNTLGSAENRMSENPLYLIAYGCALMGNGQYEKAIAKFDRACSIAPSIDNAMVYKGLALYLNGQIDEAMEIEAFRKAFVGQLKEELLKQYQRE
ncbi:MAG: MBL fold metallo-hydrolase [Syntrophobacterales bacterium]|nr:MBL fold metallo-hydrolase [Syntrophobacterales bacterium]